MGGEFWREFLEFPGFLGFWGFLGLMVAIQLSPYWTLNIDCLLFLALMEVDFPVVGVFAVALAIVAGFW